MTKTLREISIDRMMKERQRASTMAELLLLTCTIGTGTVAVALAALFGIAGGVQ